MALSFTVGGARDTFEPRFAAEVAELLEHAFGAEKEWEPATALHYGEQADWGWAELQRRAADELGPTAVPNLLAIKAEQGGKNTVAADYRAAVTWYSEQPGPARTVD